MTAVDRAAAVPPFPPAERARIVRPLLSDSAAKWNSRTHPEISGVSLGEIQAALGAYVDVDAVRAVVRGSADLVLAECVRQFQTKCYRDERHHDGRAGASTLDSLGLIARAGLRHPDAANPLAQRRLNRHSQAVRTTTEFTAATWFDHIVDPAVLGQRTGGGLHVLLVRRLRLAERHLLALTGLTPAALGLTEPHRGARPRSMTTSMHTLGLALDIAYTGNPWVVSAASWRAMKHAAELMSGAALPYASSSAYFSSLGADPGRTTGQIWDEVHRRSEEFAAYFRLAGDQDRLRAAVQGARVLPGESVDEAVVRWRSVIHRDRQALVRTSPRGDFVHHSPPEEGFLSLGRDLVIALRDHAGLAWGGVDLGGGRRGSGDMMHFDTRVDGIGRTLASTTTAWIPQTGHPCLSP
ncbi:hypothetical protein ACIBG8_12140 [Nonomuraea sp. NPDC050556]|uniref:hypothetical protein n=1 Tax=Nonomuraea sp. NPDC050556 TaxID=3364369 RepID=UPI00379FC4F7